jgi:hypothetical protein
MSSCARNKIWMRTLIVLAGMLACSVALTASGNESAIAQIFSHEIFTRAHPDTVWVSRLFWSVWGGFAVFIIIQDWWKNRR